MQCVTRVFVSTLIFTLPLAVQLRDAWGQDAIAHEHVQTVEREDLMSICSTTLSPDQKFLYATAWDTSSIVIFHRDLETGKLEYVDTLTDEEKLGGCTAFDIGPDGKLAVAVAFRNDSISLLQRDEESGKLSFLDTKVEGDGAEAEARPPVEELSDGLFAADPGDPVAGISFPIDVLFSLDGRFAYVANASNGVAVFEITDKPELKFVEHFLGDEGSLDTTREVAIHPTRQHVYTASKGSSTICALDRNPMNGQLTLSQVIADGEDGVDGIAGVHGVTCSADGKFLFAVSGRFEGDSSVLCFKINDDGTIELVNELINDFTEGFSGFLGGNNIRASRDDKSVYATGSRSGVLAAFTRDAGTGEIAFQGFLKTEDDETNLGMAAGVSISNDGKFVYVGSEGNGQVLVFSRDAG